MQVNPIQANTSFLLYRGMSQHQQTITQQDIQSSQSQHHQSFGIVPGRDQQNDKTTVEKLHNEMKPMNTKLKYEFHDKLKEYYVTIVNPKTKRVVKEIPPKKLLDFFAAMEEFNGLIVDTKV